MTPSALPAYSKRKIGKNHGTGEPWLEERVPVSWIGDHRKEISSHLQ